jgi:hypothetical protein
MYDNLKKHSGSDFLIERQTGKEEKILIFGQDGQLARKMQLLNIYFDKVQ